MKNKMKKPCHCHVIDSADSKGKKTFTGGKTKSVIYYRGKTLL